VIVGALTLLDGKFDTAHLSANWDSSQAAFGWQKTNSLNCGAHQSTWHRPKNLEKLFFFLFLSLFNCAPPASVLDYSARKHFYINCYIYIYIYTVGLYPSHPLASQQQQHHHSVHVGYNKKGRGKKKKKKKKREKLNPSCAKVILSLLQRAVRERETDSQQRQQRDCGLCEVGIVWAKQLSAPTVRPTNSLMLLISPSAGRLSLTDRQTGKQQKEGSL